MNNPTPPTNPAPAGESPAFSSEAPTPPAPGKKRASRIVTPILAGVAAIAIGLFGGILIGHNTSSTSAQAGGTRGGFGGEGGAPGAGGGFTAGTISAIDGDTITLKLTDGSTVKVTTGSSTTVTKTADGSVSDLATGDTIAVQGTKDASGTVSATSVSEGALTGGFGGGAPPSGTGN
ncbi:DUF5666 domain-containing protein [Lacisediminihabitans sp. FW035]